jgi:glutamine amidotransferase
MSIVIVDYGAGNLSSVACAVRHLGKEALVTQSPLKVLEAERVIFPGVGAARASMDNLRKLELDNALRQTFEDGRPILGICIGCQVIFESSDEDGGTPCLGLLKGKVEKFRFPRGVSRKIPHMGWNEVTFTGSHPVFKSVPPQSQFYFVHSYYVVPAEEAVVQAACVYGKVRFPAAVAQRNLVAVQFHAEKSGPPGLRILHNFLEWTPSQG